jgi:hypothetical protein
VNPTSTLPHPKMKKLNIVYENLHTTIECDGISNYQK